jgi:hypothetical protein
MPLNLRRPFWQAMFGDVLLIVVCFVVPFIVAFGAIILLEFLIEK